MIISIPIVHLIKKRFNHLDLTKDIIFCQEAAGYFYNCITADVYPLHYYHTGGEEIKGGYFESIYVPELDYTDTRIVQGIRITNLERTIYEMIEYDRYPQSVAELIYDYYLQRDIEDLYYYFNNKGKLQELMDYIEHYQVWSLYNDY